MGFTVYTPVMRGSAVAPGHASLCKSGMARFCAADLAGAGIKVGTDAAILLDDSTKRVAIRAARTDDDGLREPSLVVRWTKKRCGARINLAGPLKSLGLNVRALAGQYDVVVKDGLLILCFLKEGSGSARKRKAK